MQDLQNTVSAAEAVMSSLFGGIFLLVGLALLIAGGWLLAYRFKRTHDGKTAHALVIDYITKTESDGDTFHYPVLRTSFGGTRERDIKSSHGSEHRNWPIGATVPIRFAPNAVERFEIEEPNHMGVLGLVLATLGAGALSVSFQIAAKTLVLVGQ
jgi:Protein of unknown function (DUF3592)